MANFAEHPFSEYRLYVVLHEKEGRRMANLVKHHSKDRTTISYARYLMSVHLKRKLNFDEHVDHINEDKLDDRIENLQILTQQQNNEKHLLSKKIVDVELCCPVCKKIFYKSKQKAYKFTKLKKDVCCSRSCASIKKSKNFLNL